MELENKKFAPKFKPKFNSCDLKFCCEDYTEKDEIEFVVEFWPFSRYKQEVQKKLELKAEHKNLIKIKWKTELSDGKFTFDDDKIFNQVWSIIEKDIECECEIKSQYKELVKKQVYCERGSTLEKRIINMINRTRNFSFRETHLQEIDFGFCILKGLPDGIDNDKELIIEIKTKSCFQPISEKEKLQCLSYLRMMKFKKCFLVQSDSSGNNQIFEIDRNDSEFTEKIYGKLKDFVNKYRNMTEDEFLDKLYFYKESLCQSVPM